MVPVKGNDPQTCQFRTPKDLPDGTYDLYVSSVGVKSKDPFPIGTKEGGKPKTPTSDNGAGGAGGAGAGAAGDGAAGTKGNGDAPQGIGGANSTGLGVQNGAGAGGSTV